MSGGWQVRVGGGPTSPCVGHLEPFVLWVWRAVGQGRWDTELHPLNGTTYATSAGALRAAMDAGLVAPEQDDEL